MLKGSYRAILVYLGSVVLVSSFVSGCSASRQAVDVYLEAVALDEQGQHALAIEAFKQVIEVDRDFVLAYSGLGQGYLGTGALDEAAWALAKAATLDPWSFSDHVDLARVYDRQGKFPEAAKMYGRAAELAPEDLAVQYRAAECYLQAGQPVRALAHAEQAMKVDEPSQAVLQLLGRIHEAQGNYEQAVAAYRQMAELAGDTPDAMLAIAIAQIRNGKYGQAREGLMTVLQRWPKEAVAFRHLAYCFLKLGDTDRAIGMYEKAIDLEGNDWEAYRGLGVAYMVKSRESADDRLQSLALQYWRQALAVGPDLPGRERLQRLIKEHSMTTNPLQGLDY